MQHVLFRAFSEFADARQQVEELLERHFLFGLEALRGAVHQLVLRIMATASRAQSEIAALSG